MKTTSPYTKAAFIDFAAKTRALTLESISNLTRLISRPGFAGEELYARRELASQMQLAEIWLPASIKETVRREAARLLKIQRAFSVEVARISAHAKATGVDFATAWKEAA